MVARRYLALALSSGLLACSGSSAHPDGGADAAGFDAATDAPAVDGGGVDAAADGAPRDSAPPGDAGTPEVFGRINMLAGDIRFSTARFHGPDGYWDPVEGQRCHIETAGAECVIIRCDSGTASPNPHAGPITLTLDGSPNTYSPDADGVYDIGAPAWDPGSTVEVSAEGDTVPAFDVTITFPAAASITPLDGTIDRSMDLDLTWTPVSSGIRTSIVVGSGSPSTVELACVFDGSSGGATVPASTLGRLPAGSGVTQGFAAEIRTVTSGTTRVDVVAATRPAGVATGFVDLI